jgi:hypothetical protein
LGVRQKQMDRRVEGKGGRRRKGKRKMRDEAVEEGYISRAQRRQAQNGKGSAGGVGALGGNLLR